jgi:hypothetical protein
MPPHDQDPVDDIWRSIFHKAPIIGVTMVVCLIAGCIAVFWFAESPNYRILAVPYLTIPGALVVGFVAGLILDSIVGVFRRDETRKRKRKKPRLRIEDPE